MDSSEPIKYTLDVVAAGITVGALVDVLPAVAALVSIVWGLIRVYETKTVQALVKRWRDGGK